MFALSSVCSLTTERLTKRAHTSSPDLARCGEEEVASRESMLLRAILATRDECRAREATLFGRRGASQSRRGNSTQHARVFQSDRGHQNEHLPPLAGSERSAWNRRNQPSALQVYQDSLFEPPERSLLEFASSHRLALPSSPLT